MKAAQRARENLQAKITTPVVIKQKKKRIYAPSPVTHPKSISED